MSAELHTRNSLLAKDEILVYIDGVAAIEPMLDGECHCLSAQRVRSNCSDGLGAGNKLTTYTGELCSESLATVMKEKPFLVRGFRDAEQDYDLAEMCGSILPQQHNTISGASLFCIYPSASCD